MSAIVGRIAALRLGVAGLVSLLLVGLVMVVNDVRGQGSGFVTTEITVSTSDGVETLEVSIPEQIFVDWLGQGIWDGIAYVFGAPHGSKQGTIEITPKVEPIRRKVKTSDLVRNGTPWNTPNQFTEEVKKLDYTYTYYYDVSEDDIGEKAIVKWIGESKSYFSRVFPGTAAIDRDGRWSASGRYVSAASSAKYYCRHQIVSKRTGNPLDLELGSDFPYRYMVEIKCRLADYDDSKWDGWKWPEPRDRDKKVRIPMSATESIRPQQVRLLDQDTTFAENEGPHTSSGSRLSWGPKVKVPTGKSRRARVHDRVRGGMRDVYLPYYKWEWTREHHTW